MFLLLFGTFLSDLGEGSFESIISLSKDTNQLRVISSSNSLKTVQLIVDDGGWSYFSHLIHPFSTDQFDGPLQTASDSRGPSMQTMGVGTDAGDQPLFE
jgi:hypothetical protein